MTGYQALHESAAWLDLTGRGLIKLTGEDRARLLHAMTTNHIQQLQPGQNCYAFFLNAQGRILADATVICYEDHFLLDEEPEVREKIYQHLDKYIIADDVTLEDISESHAVVGLEGPRAESIASGSPVPVSFTGAPGFRFYVPVAEKAALVEKLQQAGAVAATAEEANIVRLEHGKPRYGEDITEKYLVQETQLMDAVNFNKGCYLGQEIVERVRSRGQVHRLLTPLRIDGTEPPAPGTKLTAAGADAGEITSAAWSPALGKVAALGYVRSPHAAPGSLLQMGDRTVSVA